MTKEIEVDTKIYVHSVPPHDAFFVHELGRHEALSGPFPTLERANEEAEKFRADEKHLKSLPLPKPKRQYKKRAQKVKPPTAEDRLEDIEIRALMLSYRPSLFGVWKRYKALSAFCDSLAKINGAPQS